MGQITVKDDGVGEADIKAFVDRRLVSPNMAFEQRFVFTTAHFGEGYTLVKKSQDYESSCLYTDGDDPSQVPSPHQYCDPEWEDCDWACPGSADCEADDFQDF